MTRRTTIRPTPLVWRSRLVVTAPLAVAMLAACGPERTSDATIAPLITTSTVATTVPPAPATTVPTGLPSTVPPPTPAPTSTVAASTTSSTSSTTTTSVPKAAKLVVAADGLGDALFGAEPEQVISYVTAVIGPPSDDSGWIDASTDFPACPGNELRIVRWDDLRLLFSDESPYGTARRHYFSYVVGPTDGTESQPFGVRTAERIGVGNTVGELRFTYPATELWVDPVRGPSFLVNGVPGGVEGTATDLGDDQFVTMVMAGPRCDG